MIHVIEGMNIEIKWRYTACLDLHIHNEECGMVQYYWRVADELYSLWRGPFGSRGAAIKEAEAAVKAAS
jgi:hypothetical protein